MKKIRLIFNWLKRLFTKKNQPVFIKIQADQLKINIILKTGKN